MTRKKVTFYLNILKNIISNHKSSPLEKIIEMYAFILNDIPEHFGDFTRKSAAYPIC